MKRVVLSVLLGGAACLLPLSAQAQVTLQNDGFVDGAVAGFQGGFVPGEMAAACFQPDGTFRPQRMQFLFGGENEGATYFQTMKVWGSGGDGAPPSDLVVDAPEVEVTASNSAFSEFDLSSYALSFDSSFCVGIQFSNGGLPSIARDDDGGNDFPGNNWIYASDGLGGFAWNQSALFGLRGDWIIRVIGTYSGGGTPDTGTPDTGTPDTGPPDTGTPDTGTPDTGTPDTGTPDTGTPDIGTPDTGTPDTGTPDTGTPDTGTPDVGEDTFVPDAGPETPIIFGVEQSSSSADDDIEITIDGQNLSAAFRYRVGGATLEDVAESNGGQLIEAVLLATDNPGPGTYELEIRGDFPGAIVDERNAITIDPDAPVLTSISPTSMTLGEDQPVTITGDNFVGNVTLLVGGQAVPGIPVNDRLLTATISGNLFNEPGSYPVIVSTDYGSSAQLAFNVDPPAAEPSSSGCAAAGASPGGAALLFGLLGLAAVRRRR